MDIKELHSFKLSDAVKFHDELNPKLWVNNKLDPDVRNALLDVAEDFISALGIKDINVEDVRVSGSNAAYSYTQHSDLDLHIIVDMSKLPDNAVYQELFNAKKTLYNDSHDITVHGVPVEVYVQDSNLPVVSLGEYSLLHNKWIRHPVKRRANFDQNATQAKYDKLADLVAVALKTKSVDRIDDILSLIKRYRKAGLSKGGEFSPENLAYKAIRSQGGIDKLYDLSDKLHSQALSIEEAGTRDDALLKIKKLQNTAGRTPSEIESIKRIIDKMMKQYNIKPEEIGQQQPVDPFKAKLAKAAYEKQMAAAAMKGEWERFKRGIFAEDEELDESEKTLLKTRRNPSPTALYNLTKRSAHQHLRGLYYNGNTYWWDADDAIHSDAAKELGIPYDYRNRLESAIGVASGNYNVIGDDGVPDSIIYRYKTEQLDEAYTTKQQVIDHFVRSARARGEDVNLAARKGAGAWERGWRGPKPKKPAEIKPYDPERYNNVRLPYIDEASGYIPSAKEKNDPRFKTALTVDVKPDAIKKNAKAFGFKTSRAGIPPQANPNGKISESFIQQLSRMLSEAEDQQELFPGYDEHHRRKRMDDWLKHTHAWDGHKPMTFYHATTKEFDTFNTHGTGFASALGMAFEVERHGSFFAVDPMFAESFIEKPDYPGEYKEGGRVIPVHLSVQNPIDLRDNNLSYMLGDEDTVEGFKANDIDLRSIYYHVPEFDRWELFDGPEGGEFVGNLQKLGFDGAIINEIIPNNSNAKSGEVWVVFNPNQVKSAVGNRGSFSPNDPNMMKETR